jgi:choline dehydrogenase
VAKAGLVEGIQESLMSEKLRVGIFDRVELEPPARVINECAEFIRRERYDLIVVLGGGSSLDTVKRLSFCLNLIYDK